MAHDKSKYDLFWKDVIRPRILARAKFKCELCGAKQYSIYYNHNGQRLFVEGSHEIAWAAKSGYTLKKIFLSVSHSDHDTTNNVDSNLRALCQLCHLNHDKAYHSMMRKAKRKR